MKVFARVLHTGPQSSGTPPKNAFLELQLEEKSSVADLKQAVKTKQSISSSDRMVVARRGAVLSSRLRVGDIANHMSSPLHVTVFVKEAPQAPPEEKTTTLESLQTKQQVALKAAMGKLRAVIKPAQLNPLIEMGFSEASATKALLLNFLNTNMALEWLFAHSNDPNLSEPMTMNEIHRCMMQFGMQMPPPVPPEVEKALATNLCSYTVTGSRFAPQNFHHCRTCGLVDGRGCCLACAKICHAGHELGPPIYSGSFYCDCGSGDAPSPCCAMNAKGRKPKQNPYAASASSATSSSLSSDKWSKDKAKQVFVLASSHGFVDATQCAKHLKEHKEEFAKDLDIMEARQLALIAELCDYVQSNSFRNGNEDYRPIIPGQSHSLQLLQQLLQRLTHDPSAPIPFSPTKVSLRVDNVEHARVVLVVLANLILHRQAQDHFVKMAMDRKIDLVGFVCALAKEKDLGLDDVLLQFLVNATSGKQLSQYCSNHLANILSTRVFRDGLSGTVRARKAAVDILCNLAMRAPKGKETAQRSIIMLLAMATEKELSVFEYEQDKLTKEQEMRLHIVWDCFMGLGYLLLHHNTARKYASSAEFDKLARSVIRTRIVDMLRDNRTNRLAKGVLFLLFET